MIPKITNVSQYRHNTVNWHSDEQQTIGQITISKGHLEVLIGLEENSQREKVQHRNR
jgi:hypothetical protein